LLVRLVPGMRVVHPQRPDWGVGQVQSVIGTRVTVGFEHAGKQLVNAAVVSLREVEDEPRSAAEGSRAR
jgi:FKBP-type peptidyl-prolyl cis-trans isomerase 2